VEVVVVVVVVVERSSIKDLARHAQLVVAWSRQVLSEEPKVCGDDSRSCMRRAYMCAQYVGVCD